VGNTLSLSIIFNQSWKASHLVIYFHRRRKNISVPIFAILKSFKSASDRLKSRGNWVFSHVFYLFIKVGNALGTIYCADRVPAGQDPGHKCAPYRTTVTSVCSGSLSGPVGRRKTMKVQKNENTRNTERRITIRSRMVREDIKFGKCGRCPPHGTCNTGFPATGPIRNTGKAPAISCGHVHNKGSPEQGGGIQ
jgi:hypothetical protein